MVQQLKSSIFSGFDSFRKASELRSLTGRKDNPGGMDFNESYAVSGLNREY